MKRLAALLGALALAAGPVPAAASTDVDASQVDAPSISLQDGKLALKLKFSEQAYDPTDAVLRTSPQPTLSWDSTDIGPGEVQNDHIRLRLDDVRGPGQVTAIDTATGAAVFDKPEGAELPAAGGGDFAWSFSKPGTYDLLLTADAVLPSGEPVSTSSTYTLEVAGPSPSPSLSSSATAPNSSVPHANLQPLAAPPPAGNVVVLNDGHVDAAAPRFVDGKFRIQVKDSTTVGQTGGAIVWRDACKVVFHVVPAAKTQVPNDARYAFLGNPGADFWLIPQVQKAGVVWAGWSTEALSSTEVSGNISWKVTKTSGPGDVILYSTSTFGVPTVLFNLKTGQPDTLQLPRGTHTHANWTFNAQGVYRLTFAMTGKKPDGSSISDSRVYTFVVGSTDPKTVQPAACDGTAPSESPTPSATTTSTGGTGSANGKLPTTGGEPIIFAAAAGILLIAGVILAYAARRPRTFR